MEKLLQPACFCAKAMASVILALGVLAFAGSATGEWGPPADLSKARRVRDVLFLLLLLPWLLLLQLQMLQLRLLLSCFCTITLEPSTHKIKYVRALTPWQGLA